ncbi:transcriptional regulator, Sir2 family [Dictyocaulus viviparus]|uniref:Transcriptional regulator, Sir2 family n=1 Tax=Dictyocaulus viviparus TaxID=29172 RepID=A0A0D8Y541_DICVI|nr:transcriptional regulator, Sir2 family [Dictyocaulus viviparus]
MYRFVPAYKIPDSDMVKKFIDKVAAIDRLLVLTGAGIPDYRSEKTGLFARSNHRPITIQEFMACESARKRYWCRNFLAWPTFSRAICNKAHLAIASWERSEKFVWLITQNIDALHTKAGSTLLSELHGCGHRVKCMECGDVTGRAEHQSRLQKLNAEWSKINLPGEIAPDGDVEIEEGVHESFVLPSCSKCGGILKTDVVFFGDNVAQDMVDLCYEKIDECSGVLVLGSSLTVNSGFRFPYCASLQGKPVLIVNIGPTRADNFAEMRISAPVTEIITKLSLL